MKKIVFNLIFFASLVTAQLNGMTDKKDNNIWLLNDFWKDDSSDTEMLTVNDGNKYLPAALRKDFTFGPWTENRHKNFQLLKTILLETKSPNSENTCLDSFSWYTYEKPKALQAIKEIEQAENLDGLIEQTRDMDYPALDQRKVWVKDQAYKGLLQACFVALAKQGEKELQEAGNLSTQTLLKLQMLIAWGFYPEEKSNRTTGYYSDGIADNGTTLLHNSLNKGRSKEFIKVLMLAGFDPNACALGGFLRMINLTEDSEIRKIMIEAGAQEQ